MVRIFAIRLLAIAFGCLLIGPSEGAVRSPGSAHRTPTPNAFICQADATITYSYDANGNRISESGQTTPIAASGTAVGSGTNFLGAGGVDTFIRSPFGHLGVFETSVAGAIVASQWLVNGSGEIAIDTATRIVGTGGNFGGTGGNDIFVRTANGQLNVWEFDQTGLNTYSAALTINGASATIDAATIAIGTGQNFLGLGGNDAILRDGTGHIGIWEINISGVVLSLPNVTSNGSAVTTAAGTILLGTGQNFLGLGGNDLFFQWSNGHLGVWELGSGAVVLATPNVTSNGSEVATGNGTSLLGTGQNFLGLGGNDLFFRWANGHLGVYELTSGAVVLATPNVTSNGSEVATGNGTSLLGTGQNFLGLGGNDLFLRWANGHLGVYELSSGAVVLATPNVTSNGSEVATGNGTSLLGTGQNFLGLGGNDLFFRWSNGHLGVYELASGAVVLATPNVTSNGSEVATGNGTSLLGTGQNFLGLGGGDLFFRNAVGDLSVWETNGSAVVLGSPALTFNGGSLVVDGRSRVTSTGIDSKNGLHDFGLKIWSGQTIVYDLGSNSVLQVSSS